MSESLRGWSKLVAEGKEERAHQDKLTRQQLRLNSLQESQKASAKRTMARMAQGSDDSLKLCCFQSWAALSGEIQQEQCVNAKKAGIRKQIVDMKQKSSQQSMSVVTSLSVSTDSGLLHSMFCSWKDDVRSEKRIRDFEQQKSSVDTKFVVIRKSQKSKATRVKELAIDVQDNISVMVVFMNWQTQISVDRVSRHYGTKMDSKKHQLEAVRHMFNKFANELGDISNTPRKGARSHSRTKSDKQPITNQSTQQPVA